MEHYTVEVRIEGVGGILDHTIDATGEIDYDPGYWGATMADSVQGFIDDVRIVSATITDEDSEDRPLTPEELAKYEDLILTVIEGSPDWRQ